MPDKAIKICVVGGGPAGYVAAIRAAQLGAKVTLFEKNELGGTCLNMGCIPTKALLKTSETYSALTKLKEFGIEPLETLPNADPASYMKRKEQTVAMLRGGLAQLMKKNGVEVIKAEAEIKSPSLVEANTADGGISVSCDRLIVTTGSRASRPPIPGADDPDVMTSDEALSLGSIPTGVTIIGSGAIGLEFATFFRGLGAQVTVLEMMDRMLPGEDADISAALARVMKKSGVKVKTGVRVTSLKRTADGIETSYEDKGAQAAVVSEKVLLAAGRRPCQAPASLAALGLKTERGAIVTDGHMRTNIDNVYAAGDSVGGKLLAHLAFSEGKVAAENAMGFDTQVNYNAVPACVYTDPEVASVGLSEEQARAAGRDISVGRFEMRANGRSQCLGVRDGFVKVVVDAGSGEILGGCILGHDASEMISVLTLAISANLGADVLADMIFPHPTVSEAIGEACADAIGRSIHK
jgi:dihydrolipoamide dehydrogenase